MKKFSKIFDFKFFPMDLGRIVCSPLLLFFRIKKITPEGKKYKEKLRGKCILAANHTAFIDPFIVGTAFWYRRLFFLVAEVVMKNAFISFLLKGMGCIRIDRNIADMSAINKSIDVVKDGRLLLVFPEGGIKEEKAENPLKSGCVLMALRSDSPILPLYIQKKKHWYNRQVLVIGEKIYPKDICNKKFPSTKDIDLITEILNKEMLRCKNYFIEVKQ